MEVAIIGGGAAGFFAAVTIKENYPSARVVICEKTNQLLAKVRISGGGRCNLTNGRTDVTDLIAAYPRGGRWLKKAFYVFNTRNTRDWFESRGVPLTVEADGRVFPASQSSQDIVDCLAGQARKFGVQAETGRGVKNIRPVGEKLELQFFESGIPARHFDKVIVASGGSPQRKGLEIYERLGHTIIEPVPSLFTFNLPDDPITALMGISVERAQVRIQGTKLKAAGPLLITHWGLSGPAVLTLSAFGARVLYERDYNFTIQVNWTGRSDQSAIRDELLKIVNGNTNKLLTNFRPFSLPDKLWRHLISKSNLPENKKWGEPGASGINKLVTVLTNDIYHVQGKSVFREEFVTCGGIGLDSVNPDTLQSKVCKNLYFAGEILDIDGLTGGFNFQAAWTTAFIAGKLL